jgi:hypothetical protein
MKIILNSDILHDERLVEDKLPKRLQQLIGACVERKHAVVIPLTSLLEFQRHQSQLVKQGASNLNAAYQLLDKHSIQYSRVEPSEVVKMPDLIGLIGSLGVEVITEDPTLEDYSEAHRRACLHERPHPEETKSDEMRDLVIWMMSLRLANQDKGALLISNDVVHSHARGDEEANSLHLARVRNIEEALEYFDVITPAGKLIRQLLEPVWDELVGAGFPAAKPMSLTAVARCRFIQDEFGLSFAHCNFKARTSGGKVAQSVIDIRLSSGIIVQVNLTDILVDGKPIEQKEISITPNKKVNLEDDSYTERLNALRAVLSGE